MRSRSAGSDNSRLIAPASSDAFPGETSSQSPHRAPSRARRRERRPGYGLATRHRFEHGHTERLRANRWVVQRHPSPQEQGSGCQIEAQYTHARSNAERRGERPEPVHVLGSFIQHPTNQQKRRVGMILRVRAAARRTSWPFIVPTRPIIPTTVPPRKIEASASSCSRSGTVWPGIERIEYDLALAANRRRGLSRGDREPPPTLRRRDPSIAQSCEKADIGQLRGRSTISDTCQTCGTPRRAATRAPVRTVEVCEWTSAMQFLIVRNTASTDDLARRATSHMPRGVMYRRRSTASGNVLTGTPIAARRPLSRVSGASSDSMSSGRMTCA